MREKLIQGSQQKKNVSNSYMKKKTGIVPTLIFISNKTNKKTHSYLILTILINVHQLCSRNCAGQWEYQN